ncbi:MAG: ABC transporter ATP-binding protein [Vampirovibrionales bacterium]
MLAVSTTSSLPTEATSLHIRGLNKSFGTPDSRIQVLHDLNVSLPTGQMVYIVGPSGCGKTTLISIIAGILSCDSGSIELFGTSVQALNQSDKASFRRENVGFIFQQFNLVPTVSIEENVAIPLLIQGKPFEQAVATAKQWLHKVGLSDQLGKIPRDLSGGQQQRVAIARALVNNPRLIICDEPTSALDGKTGLLIMKLLKEVALQAGRLVLVVTHDNRIYQFADTLVEMEDGRILSISDDASQWAAGVVAE